MNRRSKTKPFKPQKVNYINSFKSALTEYKKILFVYADNVGSSQMSKIRMKLRKLGAVLLMGKNTLMRTAIKQNLDKNPALKGLLPVIKGNCGLIFTNGSLRDVKRLIEEDKVQAPAKPGSIAQRAVVIPAQNTGMEPTKTAFFQLLDIPTKITKGTVEIINDHPLLKPGDKVTASEAQLLQLLRIFPFEYGLKSFKVYDNGSVYDPDVLELSENDLFGAVVNGINDLAAFSLEIDEVNEATVPHNVSDAFKNLLSIAVETDYDFELAKTVKEFLKDPSKFKTAEPVKTEEVKKEQGKDGKKPEQAPKE